ncbi:unnamed protein product [Prorocentrum cordatum]|uniref:Uncharacterized protein n=1 Tax=Prorocentrum cordatum TaxID=2364126 RepID=A0ABN9TNX3_9DINO|nr:unnamed protein product [Polarella glacialis]
MHVGGREFEQEALQSGLVAAGGGIHTSTEDVDAAAPRLQEQGAAGAAAAAAPASWRALRTRGPGSGAGLPGLEQLVARAARRLGRADPIGEGDSSSDSEAEPEVRPVRGGAAAGAAAARSERRRQLSSSDEETAPSRAAQSGASSSGLGGPAAANLDANGLQSLLQLRMLEVLERLETGKRSSSSGDENETAGTAVRGMRRLRQRAFRSEVKQALAVQRGMAWTYLDYGERRIPWGKLYDLKKTCAMLVAVLEHVDQGLFDEAHGQLVQIMKALEQVAINQGSWKAAWPLSGLVDPCSRRGSAGDEFATGVVAAYITELEAPESKIKQRGGVVASPEKSGNGQGADAGAGARTTGAKSTNKRNKKKKPKKAA